MIHTVAVFPISYKNYSEGRKYLTPAGCQMSRVVHELRDTAWRAGPGLCGVASVFQCSWRVPGNGLIDLDRLMFTAVINGGSI